VHDSDVLRRATIALGAILLAAVAVAIWAFWPITDPLGRPCGGGVFGTSVERPNDDSYLDVCNGLRDQRQTAVETPAIVAGLALVGGGVWVAVAVVDHRNRLT
jgi:hypothetical protein